MTIALHNISMFLVVVAGVSTESYNVAEQSMGLDDVDTIQVSGRASTSQLTFYDAKIPPSCCKLKGNTCTFHYNEPECFSLPYAWRNRATRVETGEFCINFYKEAGCRGEGFLVAPLLEYSQVATAVDLGGLAKKVVSFKPC